MSWEPGKLAEALEGLAIKMKSLMNDRREDGGGERERGLHDSRVRFKPVQGERFGHAQVN